jgi:hypothetical protein
MLLDSPQQCIQQAVQHKRASDDVIIATWQSNLTSAAEECCRNHNATVLRQSTANATAAAVAVAPWQQLHSQPPRPAGVLVQQSHCC